MEFKICDKKKDCKLYLKTIHSNYFTLLCLNYPKQHTAYSVVHVTWIHFLMSRCRYIYIIRRTKRGIGREYISKKRASAYIYNIVICRKLITFQTQTSTSYIWLYAIETNNIYEGTILWVKPASQGRFCFIVSRILRRYQLSTTSKKKQ